MCKGLPLTVYYAEVRFRTVRRNIKVEYSANGILSSMCDKTGNNEVKNEWLLNECGLNMNMSDKCEKSTLKWCGESE